MRLWPHHPFTGGWYASAGKERVLALLLLLLLVVLELLSAKCNQTLHDDTSKRRRPFFMLPKTSRMPTGYPAMVQG